MVKLVVTTRAGASVEIDAAPGISVMENIREIDDSVEAICGGMCACATCHVYIEADRQIGLPPRSYEELVMLEDLDSFDAERSRLSCQIKVDEACEDLELEVAPEE
jgi:2Fe-2S ferredoxin